MLHNMYLHHQLLLHATIETHSNYFAFLPLQKLLQYRSFYPPSYILLLLILYVDIVYLFSKVFIRIRTSHQQNTRVLVLFLLPSCHRPLWMLPVFSNIINLMGERKYFIFEGYSEKYVPWEYWL